jgi:transposase-like protein
MALERGLLIHSRCIWRWVQVYGPELDKRCRPHLKPTNKSYRVDETYIRIKGQDRYLYRAADSTGQTIDFLLTAKRDATVAKRFFRKTLLDPANPQPRVINVDKNRAYAAAVEELKVEGTLRRRCRLRQCKYLNIWSSKTIAFRRSESGWREDTNRFRRRGGHYKESKRSP